MQPWHLTLASRGRNTLFVDPAALVRGVRTLARVAGEHLLLFAIVDDHVHLVLHCGRVQAAHTASAVSRALQAAGGPPLSPVFIRAVDGRRHLETLVSYCVRQPAKHGLPGHPATYAGSCAADLLGLRVLPGFDPARIASALPRCDVRALAASASGVPLAALAPSLASDEALAAALPAAGALLPDEASRHATAMRVAFASLASHPAGVVAVRTYFRHRTRKPDRLRLAALQRRAAFERWAYGQS